MLLTFQAPTGKRHHWLLSILLILVALCGFTQEKGSPLLHYIIPAPRQIVGHTGITIIDAEAFIYHHEGLTSEALYLQAALQDLGGPRLEISDDTSANSGTTMAIELRYNTEKKESPTGAYSIKSEADKVMLLAADSEGVFYAIQTLLQWVEVQESSLIIPQAEIKDSPRYAHRGMLLDCARHFFSSDVVKKYIDLLARYKMNVLHWHLTEDQGWRIAIDAYPRLTEVGAWRTEADGSRYGGFYTKAEIRDIVAYAAERHITVIPEIELPGHSLAALAAYPHLACTDGPFEVTPEWGVFKDVYCAGNDSTFLFLERVLDEVLELFPSEYIHIGGDESPKFRWEACDKCNARMKREGLADSQELQAYFIRRVQDYLNSKDRKIIGWDEILEGGLAPGATVQSWRGMEGAVNAARAGNQAILSPTSHCYLDYGLKSIDLAKIYSFDPMPVQLEEDEKQYIIGGECNMWTEHVPDEATLDRQVMPRMIALAEVLWKGAGEIRDSKFEISDSNKGDAAYDDFVKRLRRHYPYLEARGVSFGFERVPLAFSTSFEGGQLILHRNDLLDGVSAIYSETDDEPVKGISPDLAKRTAFEGDNQLLIRAEQMGRVYPETFSIEIAVHKALGITPTSTANYSPYYTAGGFEGLTDGFKGTIDFRDGHWQGYSGTDVRLEIDMGFIQKVASVGADFYQYNNAWIFPPSQITVSTSLDGEHFEKPTVTRYDGDLKDREKAVHALAVSVGRSAQYVRIDIKNMGALPAWHDAAGSDSWIFVSEVEVR